MYRRRVAKRLVEEAAYRQVIVFTHDLTFLFGLQREAGADVHYQNVHRVQSKPGHVSDDLLIDAKAAWPMAEALRSELKAVRGDFDHWPEARRSVFADGVIGKLRKAWEQGIADLLQPVMSRFHSQVKGSSLHKLAIINDDDVIAVRSARARLSDDLHASPETINPAETSHPELLEELKKLEVWLKDVEVREAYRRTRKDGATGIDGVTAADYEKDLEANLEDLLGRMKSGRYFAPPVRRHYIPKADGTKRPLGIPTFEDKVAQRTILMLLVPIYETDFLPCSYGLRPKRSAHDALNVLRAGIIEQRQRWVIDADLKSNFDPT